jgi:hypothetical protein
MEIIIALVVLAGALYWFFIRKSEVASSEVAPYKVETPPVAEPTPAPVVEAVVETTPVVEAVVETPAKAPRKPRAPKAEKPAAKKAAPKAAAKKTVTKKPAARTVTKKA